MFEENEFDIEMPSPFSPELFFFMMIFYYSYLPSLFNPALFSVRYYVLSLYGVFRICMQVM